MYNKNLLECIENLKSIWNFWSLIFYVTLVHKNPLKLIKSLQPKATDADDLKSIIKSFLYSCNVEKDNFTQICKFKFQIIIVIKSIWCRRQICIRCFLLQWFAISNYLNIEVFNFMKLFEALLMILIARHTNNFYWWGNF